MFTLNIRNIVAVGRGGMKWASGPKASPDVIKTSLKDQISIIGNTKGITEIEFYTKRQALLEKASEDELKKLHELSIARKAGVGSKYNEILRKSIQAILDARNEALKKATAATADELKKKVPEAGPAVKVAQVRLQQGSEAVIVETSKAATEQMVKIEKTIAHKDNEPLDIQFDEKGILKANSVVDLLSDLDGIAGVERTNRGWFRRTFFGGADQKEVVGEQQLKQMLQGKNQKQLDDIYKRITGSDTGINISKSDLKTFQDGEIPQNSRYDFDHATQSKITKFQTELIQQVDVVATMSAILLGDGARTGLRAVLEGKTNELQTALNDPKKLEKFKETLIANGTLDRDPAFLEKVASVLLRIGISAGFSVFSGGIMGGYIEQGKLDVKNGKTTRGGILTAKGGIGESGSVAASVDLAAIRLEGNWNDPEMRISNRVAHVMEAQDKMVASSQLVGKINEQYGAGAKEGKNPSLSEKEQAKVDKITVLGEAYTRSQRMLDELPVPPANKTDALAKNTLTYLSKVEAIQGTTLKGIFASATLAGWMVGLSGSSVDTSASFDKLKVGAASIEGEILGKEPLTQEQVQEYLKKLGITEASGKYMENGKEILTVPDGKKVQWNIEEIITDRDTTIRAIPTLIDAKTKITSEYIKLKRTNVEAKNKYIDKNSKEVADLAKSLRLGKKDMTMLEEMISDEKYDEAEKKLQTILKSTKSNIAKGLLGEISKLTIESRKAFFDIFLGKTSGSAESRKMGAELENGKDIKLELTKYYERLARPFAGQYLLQESQVKTIFQGILPTIDKTHITTLGQKFPEGFTGLVAFNQKNKGTGFVRIDKIDHANARIVGDPFEITDLKMIESIRKQTKEKITPKELADFKSDNSFSKRELTDDQIKDIMVGGKVSAYLSFESNAECFNLGFAVEPGERKKISGGEDTIAKSGIQKGTLVGNAESGVTSFGIGVGLRKAEEEPVEQQPNTTQSPGNTSTVTQTGPASDGMRDSGGIVNNVPNTSGTGNITIGPPIDGLRPR